MPTNQPQLGSPLALEIRAAIAGWEDGDGPVHARLAAALARAISDGRLVAGTLLPPERALGERLGIARTRVAAAYRQLEAVGLAERRRGRGTQVTGPVAHRLESHAAQRATALQANAVFRDLGARRPDAVDLRAGSGPPGPVVVEALEAAMRAIDVAALTGLGAYHPRGLPLLRERVAAHLTAAVQSTEPAELLITSGSQQALHLVTACYVPPGGTVVVEDPAFSGTIDAIRAAGARVLAVPVGDDGVAIRSLEATLARNDIGAVVLTPTFQTPTGTTVPVAGRRALAELAQRTGVLLVDDATMAEAELGKPAPPPLAGFAAPGAVVTVGSLSKLAWGGLRVGWIRAPRAMIDQIAALKGANDLGSSLIGQAVAAELLRDAGALREARWAELRDRLDVLGSALRRELPDWTWRPPDGGVALWLRLPAGGATELAHRAETAGLLVTPGPVVSPTGRFDDHLVLPFDHEPGILRAAVGQLAALQSSR